MIQRNDVRVVTPGTVTEPGFLPGDANNYLASVVLYHSNSLNSGPQTASVSYADITTGEFAVTELPLEALRAELTRLHPAEILFPDNQALTPPPLPEGEGRRGEGRFHQTPYPAWSFKTGKYRKPPLAHIKG